MALYCYLKAQPQTRLSLRLWNFFPYFLSCFGLLIIISAIWPLVTYQFSVRHFSPQLLVPIPNFVYRPPTTSSAIVLGIDTDSGQYLKPETWFNTLPPVEFKNKQISSYTLSIPDLKIKQATVLVGGDNLTKSLIQAANTVSPGQIGNTVIFGHSVLPQFYNPTNYKRIFSTLPTLKIGDDVLISSDGITYRYRVIQKLEVQPDDISVLEQPVDNSYISLITCVPPGTYLRRLVVRAKLVDY